MSKKPQFYVVWAGRRPGVYDNWPECEAQVKGFPGAQFRGRFASRAEAERALRGGPDGYLEARPPASAASTAAISAAPPAPAEAVVVDASCPGNPGPVEYRGVHVPSGRVLFAFGPFPQGTNNLGEFLAVVHALRLAEQAGRRALPVYTDSATALAWLRRGRVNSAVTPGRELAARIEAAEAWLAERPAARARKWETEAWGENPADYRRK